MAKEDLFLILMTIKENGQMIKCMDREYWSVDQEALKLLLLEYGKMINYSQVRYLTMILK